MGTTVLRGSIEQTDSDLVEAVKRSDSEIRRRGRMLASDGRQLTSSDLMVYCTLASDIGYREMERVGKEILNNGGTFLKMRVSTLLKYRNGYALRVVEDGTGIEFTLPCGRSIKQYEGNPLDLDNFDTLQPYFGKDVTIDVSKKGSGYKAIMIGLSKDVLGDAQQAVRLDLIR